MRRKIFVFFIVICVCLTAFYGCKGKKSKTSSQDTYDVKMENVDDINKIKDQLNSGTLEGEITDDSQSGEAIIGEKVKVEGNMEIEYCGKKKIQYTGSKGSVRYITNPASLPEGDEFLKYNDEFFREHALLIVTETVTSGSVNVGLEYAELSGSTATIRLSHSSEAQDKTSDMTTWMMWAETEQGLNCSWIIENSAMKDTTVKK